MDAIEAILTRRCIRQYTEASVAEDDIETILRSAMAAPSAGNQQPWRFVVTTDREVLDRMAESTPYGKMLREAPLAITVCSDTRDLRHPQMWQQDCSAATQNALLTIHALGLGAVWLGFWPKMERVEPLKATLNLPVGVEPLAVLAVGHPAEGQPAVDRYNPRHVHPEQW